MQGKSTINNEEVQKFAKNAQKWWDETSGEFKMLHKMNKLRLQYIHEQLGELGGKRVLDVGCGGGILCEPLARMGAKVTGLEPAKESIAEAVRHAEAQKLELNYVNGSIESLDAAPFDAIFIMDVIEHVESPAEFLAHANRLLKRGGMLVISTINNTRAAAFFVRFMAEDVLRLVPRGTHKAERFISPQEITGFLPEFVEVNRRGFVYNPVTSNFKFVNTTQMNYFLTLQKSA